MPIAESAPAPPARHPRAPAPLLSMDDGDADDGPRARMEGTGRQYAPFAGSFEGAPEPKARELMPRLWRRFKQQKEGGVPADELPISGANITLEDLAIRCATLRPTRLPGLPLPPCDRPRHQQQSRLRRCPIRGRRSEDEPQTDPGTDLDEALQAGRPISGWIGTPDPAKFAPGTNVLTAKELEEEVRRQGQESCFRRKWARCVAHSHACTCMAHTLAHGCLRLQLCPGQQGERHVPQ